MEAMITDMMSGKESDKEEDPIIVQKTKSEQSKKTIEK